MLWRWWQPVVFKFKDGFVPCEIYNFWSKPCNPLIYKLGKQEMAANVFLALVIIMHFGLFVRACVLTHRLRKLRKSEAVARRNIELQYNRSPVDHNTEAPPAYSPRRATEGLPKQTPITAPSPVSPSSLTSSRRSGEEQYAKFAWHDAVLGQRTMAKTDHSARNSATSKGEPQRLYDLARMFRKTF